MENFHPVPSVLFTLVPRNRSWVPVPLSSVGVTGSQVSRYPIEIWTKIKDFGEYEI